MATGGVCGHVNTSFQLNRLARLKSRMFAAQILSARIEVRSSICESRYLDHKRWTFTVQPLQACCTNSNRLPRSKKHNIQETQFFNLVFCEVQLACDIRICQSIAQRTIDGKKYAQSRPKSTHCALLFSQKVMSCLVKRTWSFRDIQV